jgi:hypothetical protein
MNEQPTLFDVRATVKLTARQQAVLDALQAAGPDGLDTDQAGAIAHELRDSIWAHDRDRRCQYCASAGKEILKALAAKGLARYRRADRSRSLPGIWLSTDQPQAKGESARGMLDPDEPLPF